MPTQILVTQNIDQHSTQATPINNPIKIKYLLGIIIVQVVLVTRRHLFYYNHCIYLYSIQLMLTRVPMKAEFRISSSAPEYIHKRRKRLRNTTLTPNHLSILSSRDCIECVFGADFRKYSIKEKEVNNLGSQREGLYHNYLVQSI